MITPRRLFSNTVVVVIGAALQRLLSFATTLVLARGLGGEHFGVYAFVVTYMFIFSFLVDLGFERMVTREIARTPERTGRLIGTGIIIRSMLSVTAAVAAIAVAWCLRLPSSTRWCIVVAALNLPLSVESFVRAFFQARYEMHRAYMLSLPGTLAFLLLAATTMWMGRSLVWVFGAALAAGVFSVSLMFWIAIPQMHVVWRPDWRLARSLWRQAWELGAVLFIWLITLRIDQLLLYWLRSASDVGQYAVAVKITEALSMISESTMVTVFPLLASTERTAQQRFQRIYQVTVRYLVALVLPIALVATVERELIMRALFGAAYVAGADALAILAWGMVFSYIAAVYVSLIIVRGQQPLLALVSAVSLVANVALNLLWIPRWGATGAAAAMLATNAGSFLLLCVAPQSRSMMRGCCAAAARPLAALAASVVLVGWLAPVDLRLWIALPLYLMALPVFGAVGAQDWALARQLLRSTPRLP